MLHRLCGMVTAKGGLVFVVVTGIKVKDVCLNARKEETFYKLANSIKMKHTTAV